MFNADNKELEGITLRVYLYIIRKGKAVGPRDVMKGVQLSSPSVAYRHLQKLEDLGYLKKSRYGEYSLKKRASLRDYMWISKYLLSKMLIYSIIFLIILVIEFVIFMIHYPVENYTFKVFFLLLMIITGFAMSVFGVEGFLQQKRLYQTIQV
ncbi:MAG: hypothetical protein AC479_07605 [miscellaneous Crenarchaeota group-6 archaeon AD8-1]|nr:MAG: hypothetical protein AC479_07605 [miscellaneous Crenarchaeota group-6 archaeon AD8-1]